MVGSLKSGEQETICLRLVIIYTALQRSYHKGRERGWGLGDGVLKNENMKVKMESGINGSIVHSERRLSASCDLYKRLEKRLDRTLLLNCQQSRSRFPVYPTRTRLQEELQPNRLWTEKTALTSFAKFQPNFASFTSTFGSQTRANSHLRIRINVTSLLDHLERATVNSIEDCDSLMIMHSHYRVGKFIWSVEI